MRMVPIKHTLPLTEDLLNICIVIHHKSVIKHIVCGCAGISVGEYSLLGHTVLLFLNL